MFDEMILLIVAFQKMIADFLQISETNVGWRLLHFLKKFSNLFLHTLMVLQAVL